MKLSQFFGFSQKKPNLSPSIAMPSVEDLHFLNTDARRGGYSLRDFASKRIQGNDLGFGDQFTDKMSSPGIAQIDANFKNRTLPTLSSEASKRGLGRSSIVQDQIGQADLQRNRDIDAMVANFQYLNEQQKKTDQNNAVNLAQDLDREQLGAAQEMARSSERTRDLGVQQDNAYNAESSKNLDRTIQAVATLVGGPMGGSLSSMFTPKTTSNQFTGGTNSIKTDILGSSNQQFEAWLDTFLGGA